MAASWSNPSGIQVRRPLEHSCRIYCLCVEWKDLEWKERENSIGKLIVALHFSPNQSTRRSEIVEVKINKIHPVDGSPISGEEKGYRRPG